MSLKEHGVFPDVLDEFQATTTLTVSYKSGCSVDAIGMELTPTQVVDCPSVKWEAEAGAYYNPDAPSRAKPSKREWLHYTVGNIEGNDVSSGKELVGYVGSAPPKTGGIHRYVWALFKQPGKIDFKHHHHIPNTSGSGRPSTCLRDFASKYNLTPVACTMYQAQYDSTCDKIYAQLK